MPYRHSIYALTQAEEAALEVEVAELDRAMAAMTEDPVNRRRLYLLDREVRLDCIRRL